jgi:hypothetical protein
VKFDPSVVKRLTDVLLVSHERTAQLVDAARQPVSTPRRMNRVQA